MNAILRDDTYSAMSSYIVDIINEFEILAGNDVIPPLYDSLKGGSGWQHVAITLADDLRKLASIVDRVRINNGPLPVFPSIREIVED